MDEVKTYYNFGDQNRFHPWTHSLTFKENIYQIKIKSLNELKHGNSNKQKWDLEECLTYYNRSVSACGMSKWINELKTFHL